MTSHGTILDETGGGGKIPATPSMPSSSKEVRSSPRIAARVAMSGAASTTTAAQKRKHTTTRANRLPPFQPHRRNPPQLLPPSKVINLHANDDDVDESQEDLSQELLSPPPPVEQVVNNGRGGIESQITLPSPIRANYSESEEECSGDEEGEKLANYFNASSEHIDHDGAAVDDDLSGMHGFSGGDEFEINERCSYYMDCATITLSNCQAVEFVYMIESETLCRGENTMKLADLKTKIFEHYRSLIRAIRPARFSEFDLQEKMILKIFNAKAQNGSATGHYAKTMEVKAKVQAIVRQIPTLPKLPSGKDIIDVRDDYILHEYKSEMGEVSFLCE